MLYRFHAVTQQGEPVSGDVEADGERTAARLLRQQDLVPTDIVPAEQPVRAIGVKRNRRVGRAELALLTHELSTLLKSGIPLAEAVDSLAHAHSVDTLGEGLGKVYRHLRAGLAFSAALESSGLDWPDYLVFLVKAGEQTGRLADALDSAAVQMDRDERIGKEIRTALLYPSVLVFSGTAATLLIFVVVVPKFAGLLKAGKAKLPEVSIWVLETGMFVQEHLLAFGLGLIAFVFAGTAALGNRRLRAVVLDGLSRAPVVGRWIMDTELTRWAAMLSTLLENRVPLLQSFALAEQGVRLAAVRHAMQRVSREIRAGKKVADSVEATRMLGLTALNLIRVGERSGALAATLRTVAELYENASRDRLKRFLVLLEPLAILLIGGVIGFIMVAIILAITSMSDIAF